MTNEKKQNKKKDGKCGISTGCGKKLDDGEKQIPIELTIIVASKFPSFWIDIHPGRIWHTANKWTISELSRIKISIF